MYECNKDIFLILFLHLGVVKVGLLRLAKPEVINLHLISATTKNSMLDRTLTTPNKNTNKMKLIIMLAKIL